MVVTPVNQRPTLDAILLQQLWPKQAMEEGKIKVEGTPQSLGMLLGMLDNFPPDFELIAPNPPVK